MRTARSPYLSDQETIYSTLCDLSGFRLLFGPAHLVAVLGSPPPEELGQRLDACLAGDEPVTLPPEASAVLRRRRDQARQLGPCVERYVWPPDDR